MLSTGLTLLAVLLTASPSAASSPFDGAWKTDLATIAGADRREDIAVGAGIYRCASCAPAYAVRTDGGFHAVDGQGDMDETAITVVDAATITRVNRLKGRVVRIEKRSLSADGRSATMTFTDTLNAGGASVSGTQRLDRTSRPRRRPCLVGGWTIHLPSSVSDAALTQTFRIDGDVLTFANGEGFGYRAPLDGTPAATHGDPTIDHVSVRRQGANSLVEEDWGQGGLIVTFTYSVPTSGDVLTITSRSAKSGRTTSMTAHRLPG